MSGPSTGGGRFAAASRDLLRQTIVAATDELVAESSWGEVTMADVAARAGVSRQTVYNEIGGRDDLARTYALWAAERLLDEVERSVLDHRDDLTTACVATMEVFLRLASDHPLVRALTATTGSDDLRAVLITTQGRPLVEAASERLGRIISTTWPGIDPRQVDLVGETLVRLAISHLVLPTAAPADAAAATGAVLGPLLDRVDASAPSSAG